MISDEVSFVARTSNLSERSDSSEVETSGQVQLNLEFLLECHLSSKSNKAPFRVLWGRCALHHTFIDFITISDAALDLAHLWLVILPSDGPLRKGRITKCCTNKMALCHPIPFCFRSLCPNEWGVHKNVHQTRANRDHVAVWLCEWPSPPEIRPHRPTYPLSFRTVMQKGVNRSIVAVRGWLWIYVAIRICFEIMEMLFRRHQRELCYGWNGKVFLIGRGWSSQRSDKLAEKMLIVFLNLVNHSLSRRWRNDYRQERWNEWSRESSRISSRPSVVTTEILSLCFFRLKNEPSK
jgi:hypothetical protein